MKITIPSKNEKQAAQIRDAFRILAWQNVMEEKKAEKQATGSKEKIDFLALYQDFYAEWEQSEYFSMNLEQLLKLMAELGYSSANITAIRKDYYDERIAKKAVFSSETKSETKVNFSEEDMPEDMPY